MDYHKVALKLGAAILVLCQVAEALAGDGSVFPLGHSEIAEGGIVFGACFAIAEVVEQIRNWFRPVK